ncbi:hypothetical protein SAMN05421813_103222, partial [Daejeonella rubra]
SLGKLEMTKVHPAFYLNVIHKDFSLLTPPGPPISTIVIANKYSFIDQRK